MPLSSNRTFVSQPANREIVDLPNDGTSIWVQPQRVWTKDTVRGLKAAFTDSLRQFAKGYAATTEAGLAYALFSTSGRLEMGRALGFSGQRVQTAIIGRHTHADSPGGLSSFALRHLLVVHTRFAAHRVQLYDLHSAAGTQSIKGDTISSVAADLPAIVILGPYLLLLVQTPLSERDPAALLDTAVANVTRAIVGEPIKERVAFKIDQFAEIAPGEHAAARGGREPTRIFERPLSPPTDTSGQLVLVASELFEPDATALAAGCLIGRYERCHAPTRREGLPESMSRVHALLFSANGELYLADVGSMNGISHGHLGGVRYKHIETGDVFWLGGHVRITVERAQG